MEQKGQRILTNHFKVAVNKSYGEKELLTVAVTNHFRKNASPGRGSEHVGSEGDRTRVEKQFHSKTLKISFDSSSLGAVRVLDIILRQNVAKQFFLKLKQEQYGNGEEIACFEYFAVYKNLPVCESADFPCITVAKLKKPAYFPLEPHMVHSGVRDPRNSASYRGAAATLADKSGSAKFRKEYPKSYDLTRQFVEDRKPHTVNAWQLRETHQHLIPVSVHKNAKCNIPDIGESKYHVHGDMPLRAFVKFIRTYIRDFDAGQPISVSIKNTKPASETLMSKIDAENKDEDGLLHMTYTGEQKEVVGAARSDIIPRRVRRKTAANRAAARVRRKATANRAAARSDIALGRFKRRKKIGKIQISRWIGLLDPWDHYAYRDYPWMYTPEFLNARELRAREPDHIPVSVEKYASSDIPDIDMTKYNVHRDMPQRIC